MACPVLPNISDDGLFLLEVLIDKITFPKGSCYDKKNKISVVIQCFFMDSFEISADGAGCNASRTDGSHVINLNSGKSCLFSLKENEILTAVRKLPINVTVYAYLPCGCSLHRIVVGEATIDMTKEFVQARIKYKENPNNVSYQALRDSFRIIGPGGVETGEILMFLRISCFGKLIVTRFQGFACPSPLGPDNRISHDGTTLGTSCTSREFQIYQVSDAPPSGEHTQHGQKFSGQPCITEGYALGGTCPPGKNYCYVI